MGNTHANTAPWLRWRLAGSFALTLAMGVGLVACTERIAGSPNSERTLDRSVADESAPPSNSERTGDETAEEGRGETSGSAEDAPFDVCTVVSWTDAPAAARPTGAEALQPERVAAESTDAFDVGCVLPGRPVRLLVVWGRESRMSVEPAGVHGEKQVRIGEKPGLLFSTISPKMESVCVAKVALGDGRGIAGVSAVSTVPGGGDIDMQPCAIASQLAAEIVTRTS